MPRLTAPLLDPGWRKRLSDELHALHRRAGWPSVRDLSRSLDGAASSSRVHDAFTNPRLPGWGLLEVLVTELASRVPGGVSAEQEVQRFHALWDAVAEGFPESSVASAEQERTRVFDEAPNSIAALKIRRDAARWRADAGDAAGAAAAFTELVPDYVRAFGADHRSTLKLWHDAARWRAAAGDVAGAAAAFTEMVPDYVRVFGADHRRTRDVRNHAANCRGRAGDAAGAAAAFTELVADYVRVFGADHRSTLSIRNRAAHWHGEARKRAAP